MHVTNEVVYCRRGVFTKDRDGDSKVDVIFFFTVVVNCFAPM